MLSNFICQRCGNCCRIKGIVRLEDTDIRKIAVYLQISERTFIDRYTQLAADRKNLILLDGEGDDCIFLDSRSRCAINSVKPRQCRDFPRKWRNVESSRICRGVSE